MAAKTPKGTITKKQGIISIVVGILVGVTKWFLNKKGIDLPIDDFITPEEIGLLTTAVTGTVFIASGPKKA